MSNKSFFPILIFFLVSQFDRVFSIKCFECESRFDPRCLDPFSLAPLGLVDCDKIAYEPFLVASMCRKISYDGNVYRSCYHVDPADTNSCQRLNDRNQTLVTAEYCHICTDDGCNSAIKYMPSVLVIAALILSKCIS